MRLSFISTALVAGALLALPATAPAASTTLVINEIDYDQVGTDTAEFVEIRNVSSGTINLDPYNLRLINGSNGQPYNPLVDLPSVDLAPGAYYVICGDLSPTECDLDAGSASDLIQNGSPDAVQLYNADGPVDTVSYEGTITGFTEGSGTTAADSNSVPFVSISRNPDGVDTDNNNADFDLVCTTPGAANTSNASDCPDPAGPPPPPQLTKISAIQGAGDTTPMLGRAVTIEGIVTGVDDEIGANFERTFPGDAGIFVQEEQADQDSDANSSEGVFVGFVRPRATYPPGTIVRLEGTVAEQFTETRVNLRQGSTPTIVGTAPVPSPVVIDPFAARAQAVPARPYYESLEGMNVLVDVGTATSGGRNRFGETFLTLGVNQDPEDRVFRTEPTPELIAADSDAGAGDPNNPLEDTDSTTELPVDLFDVVRGLEGPLNFSFGHYKVINQERHAPAIEQGPTQYPYNELAPRRDDQLRVASFNVENFFPAGSSGDIGHIRTQEEYEEQRDRIADAIGVQLERPDIVAVQEVADLDVLQDLAATLGGYTAYLEPGNDERGIDVGFLIADGVEHSNVRQLGKTATGPAGFSCSDVAGALFDRPPLAVDVTHRGVSFTLFSNHFASKSAPDECRAAQAAFVRDQVASIEAAGGEAMVMGDLNAFETESALKTFEDGKTSLDNLWDEAPESERYSYHFDGRLQTLDHMLVTDGLFPRVEDFRYAHFDNDYYERRAAPRPDGHGLSDHDPPIVTLDFAGEPVSSAAPEIVRRNDRKPVTRNETLTADLGGWEVDEGELSFDIQWLRCDSGGCAAIDGATGSTYQVAKADKGHSIVLRVTATGDGGSATAVSAPVGPVQGPSVN